MESSINKYSKRLVLFWIGSTENQYLNFSAWSIDLMNSNMTEGREILKLNYCDMPDFGT